VFEIKPYRSIISDLHKIINNYVVLFDDGDNPILYSGTNAYGNRLIGIIMFDDDEAKYLRYIHTLVSDNQYLDFINKRVTLRRILETNQSFFLVDRIYDGSEVRVALTLFEDVPNEYLPLENSYCPDFIIDPSFNYAVSLKGNIADVHLAYPEDLNSVNTHISSFIKTATEFLNDIRLSRHIYVQALNTGSFKINFKIEIDWSRQDLFAVSVDDVRVFIMQYFKYVIEELPHEEANIFKGETVPSQRFAALQQSFDHLYTDAGARPPAGVEQRLIDMMSYSVERLQGLDYSNGFNKLEFINYDNQGQESSIGILDEQYIPSVTNKFFKAEEKHDLIEYDQQPTEYNIQVYLLNNETGNGNAYLHIQEGIRKVSLHLRGLQNYQNTIFTHNMDEENATLMAIKAIGKRVNGIVTELTYTYE
jgi:hypothetical protein